MKMTILLSITQMTNLQEWTCIWVTLNSQEWTRILMPSPQEVRWTLKPMEMSPKSRTRYMALDNKIPLSCQLNCQAPNQHPLRIQQPSKEKINPDGQETVHLHTEYDR